MRVNLRSAGAATLVAIPTVLAFFSGGFFDRPRLIGALAAWVLVVVGALTVSQPLPATTPARLAMLGLLALCAWTALSLLWTPTPARAEDDFQRLLLYAGVFIAAFALLRGDRAQAWLEPALLLGIVIVIGYGLSERLFPELLEFRRSRASAGRLEQPLTYWNAVGALGAMGVVLAIRLAADDRRAAALRAAAAAAGVVLGLGVYLSFSRGALAAVGAGVLVLLALAPSGRAVLRSAGVVLVLGILSAVVASLLPTVESLAVGTDGSAGEGVIMLVTLVVLGAAAAALQLALRSRESSGAQRLRLPVSRAALVVGVTAVAIGGAALATVLGESPRGESPAGGASPQRLGSVDTNRYRYWEVALETFGDHPIAGIGSGGFFVEWRRLPYPQRIDQAADAHSLPLETVAELGLVGLAALLLLLGGVVGGARRLFGHNAEVAVGPIAACTAWGVHSAIDWDWEMPAVTLPALILAAALLAWSDPLEAVRDEAGARRYRQRIARPENRRTYATNLVMRIAGFPLVLMLTLALAAVPAALPVTALAQSAGDDQYVDPFQNDGAGNNQDAGGGGGGGGGGAGGETTTAPPTDIPESTVDETIAPQSAVAAETTAQEGAALPRSGLPVLGLAAIGALLLGGGAALRRRA